MTGNGDDVEHARANVKVLMANIEKAGQNHVRNALSEPGRDPFKAIADVQDSLSIGFIRIDPALQFLDALGLTRLAVNSSLLESLKDTLLQTVQHMTEDSLVSLLKATYIFMAVADLKAIPVAVLKRLRRIPDRYLEFLLQKGYIAEFSFTVRRQAWEKFNQHFVAAVEVVCAPCVAAPRDAPLAQRCVRGVAEMVGDSEALFGGFAQLCAARHDRLAEDATSLMAMWGGLLLSMHLEWGKVQQRENRAAKTDKLRDLAGLLDRCRRQKTMSRGDLVATMVILRSLVVSQASAQEKAYQLQHGRPFPSTHRGPVAAHLPKAKPPSESTGVKRKAPDSPEDVRRVLRDGLRFLSEADDQRVFADPVSDRVAPNYSRIIARPMSLSVLRSQLRSDRYASLAELDADVQLMFDNCVAYNGEGSYFGQLARKLAAKWRGWCKKHGLASAAAAPAEVGGALDSPKAKRVRAQDGSVTASVQRAAAKIEGVLGAPGRSHEDRTRSCLLLALDFAASLDPGGVFAYPVTDDIAPEYSVVVAHPMCLQDARRKVQSRESADLRALDADMQLIVSNCLLYNEGVTAMEQLAETLRDGWGNLYRHLAERCPGLLSAEPEAAPVPQVDGGPETQVEAAGRYRHSGQPITLPGIVTFEAARSAVQSSQATAPLRALLALLWDYATGLDAQGFFAAPVTQEGYLAAVAQPMDLSTVKLKMDRGRYRALADFRRDAELLTNNCLAYNLEASPAHQAAEKLRFGLDLSLANAEAALSGDNSLSVALPAENSEAVASALDESHSRTSAPRSSTTEKDAVTVAAVEPAADVATDGDRMEVCVDSVPAAAGAASAASAEEGRASEAVHADTAAETAEGKLSTGEAAEQAGGQKGAVRPTAEEALRSSREAADALRAAQSGSDETRPEALPGLFVEGRLALALMMLKDRHVQQLVLSLLAERLVELATNACRDGQSVTLPFEDGMTRLALQLSQLSFLRPDHRLHGPDDGLLREVLPHLLTSVFRDREQVARRVAEARSSRTAHADHPAERVMARELLLGRRPASDGAAQLAEDLAVCVLAAAADDKQRHA